MLKKINTPAGVCQWKKPLLGQPLPLNPAEAIQIQCLPNKRLTSKLGHVYDFFFARK